jgi:hypothetical protein
MTTTIVPAPSPSNRPDLISRWVTGTPTEVTATLALLRQSGHLVSSTAPKPINPAHPRDRRVIVLARVRTQVPDVHEARPVRSRAWVKPGVVVGSVLGGLFALGFLGYLLIGQIVNAAAAASSGVLGFVALVLIAVAVVAKARSKGACMGLHCSGCGHR